MNNIIGWDTETIDGKVILLANSERDYIYNDSEPLDFDEMLEFLFRYGKNKLNYFYNVSYDCIAILRNIKMESKKNAMLINFMKMSGMPQTFDDYSLKLAHKVFMNLKKEGKERNSGINFYDIMTFFPGGLNKNSIKYLGVGKDNFDSGSINKDKLQRNKKYLMDFINYCIVDCKRTKELTLYAVNLYKSLTDKPLMTPAGISERHLIQNMKKDNSFKNYFVPFRLYRFLMSVFYGGRFEDTYKGVFDKCYNYDINSAYPKAIYELRKLNGIIDHGDSFNIEDIYHFYGVYSLKIHQFKKFISPIIIRKPDKCVFNPNVKKSFYHLCTYYDTLALKESGVRFDVIDVLRFHHTNERLFPYFQDLYSKRLKLKKEKNDQQLTYKIILNSTYGKMLYLIKYMKKLNKPSNISFGGEYYQKIFYPGKIFQPLFAAYITSWMRYLLLNACDNENVISYATDGIYTKRKINVSLSDELGEWSLDEYGNSIFVRNGIRKIGNKINARGYMGICTNSDDDKKEIEKKKDNFIKLIKSQEWEQKELISTSHFLRWFHKVHTFQKVKKKISFHHDEKRVFPFVDSDDILNKQIKSKPYINTFDSLPYKNEIILLNKKDINILK